MDELNKEWAELDGAGPHVLAAKGADFANTLGEQMKAHVAQLGETYGVDIPGAGRNLS